MKKVLLLLALIPALCSAASLECYMPDNPKNIIKGLYNVKNMKNQLYIHLNNGRRTFRGSVDFKITEEGKFFTTGDHPMMMHLLINGDYYDDGHKPSSYYSNLKLGLAGNVTYNSNDFVCRVYPRWPK